MSKLLEGSGKLVYGNNWCFLGHFKGGDDIIHYYQWFLKRHYHGGLRLHAPKVGPHVTLIRGEERDPIEAALKEQFWRKYENLEIPFTYKPEVIGFNGEYFWFDVFCPFLETVRTELGLSPKPIYDYHLTIGKLYPEDVENFQTYQGIHHIFDID